jgi:hypothetical protein
MFDSDAEWKGCHKVASVRGFIYAAISAHVVNAVHGGGGMSCVSSADCRGTGEVYVEVLALVKRLEHLKRGLGVVACRVAVSARKSPAGRGRVSRRPPS